MTSHASTLPRYPGGAKRLDRADRPGAGKYPYKTGGLARNIDLGPGMRYHYNRAGLLDLGAGGQRGRLRALLGADGRGTPEGAGASASLRAVAWADPGREAARPSLRRAALREPAAPRGGRLPDEPPAEFEDLGRAQRREDGLPSGASVRARRSRRLARLHDVPAHAEG